MPSISVDELFKLEKVKKEIEVNESAPEPSNPMELGVQPLDRVLSERGIANSEVVAASTEQITHKMVARGRKGRMLTRNVQRKLLRAVNNLPSIKKRTFEITDLFNYRGK